MMLTGLVVVYYTFIYIHELPYEAAKHRNHPQQDAIYVACWLSLFTLHAIWPFGLYLGPFTQGASGGRSLGGYVVSCFASE